MKNLVTALMVLAIFALAAMFGFVLVESKIQAAHAVGSTHEVNIYGVAFLAVALTACSSLLSYIVIDSRKG